MYVIQLVACLEQVFVVRVFEYVSERVLEKSTFVDSWICVLVTACIQRAYSIIDYEGYLMMKHGKPINIFYNSTGPNKYDKIAIDPRGGEYVTSFKDICKIN